jgi:hypothetical protein
MRIASYETSDGASFGLITDGGVIDAGRRSGVKSPKQCPEPVNRVSQEQQVQ